MSTQTQASRPCARAVSCVQHSNGKRRHVATAATRRQLQTALTALVAGTAPAQVAHAAAMEGPFTSEPAQDPSSRQGSYKMPEAEWKQRLTQPQYAILRQGSTERPFVSPLLNEKRKGAPTGCPHASSCCPRSAELKVAGNTAAAHALAAGMLSRCPRVLPGTRTARTTTQCSRPSGC